MTKRVINIEAEYDLDDPELTGIELTKRDVVERIVQKELLESFEQDEGFVSLTVTCSDFYLEERKDD